MSLNVGSRRVLLSDNWSPKQLPGHRTWWTAKDIVGIADGASLDAIPLRLGAISALTQSVSTAKPTFKVAGVNGRPSVLFQTDDFVVGDGLAGPFGQEDSPNSLFIACKWDSHDGLANTIWSVGRSNNDDYHQNRIAATTQALQAQRNGGGSAVTATSAGTVGTTAQVLGFVFLGTTVRFWRNGLLIDTAALDAPNWLVGASRFTYGCLRRGTTVSFLPNTHIMEAFTTTGAVITSAMAVRAQTYLKSEWGI